MEDQTNHTISTTDKLFVLLARSAYGLRRGHAHHGRMHPGQMRILAILNQSGPIAQKELMDAIQVRAGSLSEILSKLEDKGLIIRTKQEDDKRSVMVELSAEGKVRFAEGKERSSQFTKDQFAALSSAEQEQLLALLEKLTASWHDQRFAEGDHEHCGHHGRNFGEEGSNEREHCGRHHHHWGDFKDRDDE